MSGVPPMLSFRARLLRLVLRVRRRFVDWEAPVEKFRAMVRRSERYFRPPADVAISPETAAPVPGEWLTPPAARGHSVLLYLHGGGWTLGWTSIHRRMVAYLARADGVRAFAVDYRLAPEHPFPAALDDCLASYRWLLSNGTPPHEIVLAGDSAGGNLTLACLMALRDAGDPLPAAAVCIGPMTDLAGTGASFHTRRDVVLTPQFALNMARHYAGSHDPRTPLLSPYYGDLHGLPPLLVHAGGDEILRSDAERLADQARAAGIDVSLSVWPGLWHVWHLFAPSLPEARQAVDDIGAFVRRHLVAGEPP
jgi:acetyl esterase/lipase